MPKNSLVGRRVSCDIHEECDDHVNDNVLMSMVRSVSIGLLVILLSVYLGFCLHTAHIQSCVDELKQKFMTEKERCQDQPKGTVLEENNKYVENEKNVKMNEAGRLDEQHIRNLFRQELDSFEVDRTGMTDFAMGALGGRIVSTPKTKTYGEGSIWNSPPKRGPSTILEPCALPGDCWAFLGKNGCVVIRLFAKIVVTNVTLEHISRDLSPTGITSAPRIFSMVGLDDPASTTGHNFGSFVYKEIGPSLQTFPVRFTFVPPFEYIKIDFQENHGHEEFTCVYRIRIHGKRSQKPIRTDRLPDSEET